MKIRDTLEIFQVPLSGSSSDIDIAQNKSVEQVTVDIWKCMANSIEGMLTFTTDTPEEHKNGDVSILYIQAKAVIRDGKQDISYKFYEKEVSNKKVIMERSGITIKIKLETLGNEVFRRLHNCEREIEIDEMTRILNTFMIKMANSGYDQG